MLQFFSTSLPWAHPLEVFPFFADTSFMLFYSGTPAGEFSFFPLSPQNWWMAKHGEKDFLEKLSARFTELKKTRDEIPKDVPFPFTGGFCGVFSYDFVREYENIPENTKMEKNIPTAIFAEYDAGMVFRESTKECWYFCWEENEEEFAEKKGGIEKFPPFQGGIKGGKTPLLTSPPRGGTIHWSPEITKEKYISHVRSCQKALHDGMSFQINFSQKFTAQTEMDDWDIFRLLAEKNPAPMMIFLSAPLMNVSLLSSSPERLFSLDRNGNLFTQPIAGTRKRGSTPEEDKVLEKDLKSSPKEMAEHSMLVDLLRNDFGHVCEFGSVQVQEFARVERYASVMHLVSDIVGKLDPKKTVFDSIKAVFPGGTITGAPKIETMKILSHEEISSRNFYCGSAGYISFSDEADFNILIRTLEKNGETLSLRVGGGIVVDGDPEQEYEETLHKAKGVQKALDTKK